MPTATAPASPAAQIAAPLLALGAEPAGLHRLTVHLHPADLGPVSVVAEIRGGDIHLQLAGSTEAGREALRAALPDLRRELQQAGFQTASLDVALDFQQEAPGQGQPRQQPGPAPAPDRSPAVAVPVPVPAPNRPGDASSPADHLDMSL